MRRFIVISFILFSLVSKAADVCVQHLSMGSEIGWSITNQAGHIVYRSLDFGGDSICYMTLQDNANYSWNIFVEQVDVRDTVLMTLAVDGNVILALPNTIALGDNQAPFTAGVVEPVMKIVGGTDADIEDFPWQVFFRFGDYMCGGTIIAERWILTAAHCTQDDNGNQIDASQMYVLVGTDNRGDGSGKRYYVEDYIVHEAFHKTTLLNDIALLELKEAIDYPNAEVISLVSSYDVDNGATVPGVMATISGWGYTDAEDQTLTSKLQKVQLPIVANNIAEDVWGVLEYSILAAGYENGNKDACNGDSGGPLVVEADGKMKVAGIVSFGSEECNTYGGYTRVSSFLPWIERKTLIVPLGELAFVSGDLDVCYGTSQSIYEVSNGNTDYEWIMSPAEAGELAYEGNVATVTWDETYIGDVRLQVHAKINGEESLWKKIEPRVIPLTQVSAITADTVICESETLTLELETEGDALVYDWYKDDEFYRTTYQSYLTLSNVDTLYSGHYKCLVKGTCGEVMSPSMQVTVWPTTRVYNKSSLDIDVTQGSNTQLSVRAIGHDVSYQWYKNGKAITGATRGTYDLVDVNASDIGNYFAVAKGSCLSDKSETVYLYVDDKSLMYNARIWPSVCTDVLHVAISTNFPFDVSINDVNGRLKKEEKSIQNSVQLTISDLPVGVYFIRIESESLSEVFRFLKQ